MSSEIESSSKPTSNRNRKRLVGSSKIIVIKEKSDKQSLENNNVNDFVKKSNSSSTVESNQHKSKKKKNSLLLESNGTNNIPKKSKSRECAEKKVKKKSEKAALFTVNDLSVDFLKRCTKAKLEQNLMEKNVESLFTISNFLFKDPLPSSHKGLKIAKIPNATPQIIEHSTKLIMKPLKPMKKLYTKLELSGKGGFGSVYIAKDCSTKKRVAVKKLPHETEKNKESNYCELFFMSTCKHPNIVAFYCCFQVREKDATADELWIVMEYLEGGTLAQASKIHKFSDQHIAYVAREILKALKYLHSRKFAHRDLKSANVMMSIKGEIKLIDFGLCADFSEGPRVKILGSPYWIPPEMIKYEPHSFPADVWSFAVCLLELLLMNPPFGDACLNCMFAVATEGLISTIPLDATKDSRDFLNQCLIVDPEKRATAESLLKHPWVNQPDIEHGVIDVLKQVFLSSSLESLGF